MMSLYRAAGHNGWVARRAGWLVGFFGRAEPREAAPSGWALAFDATVAVAAAAGAFYEMAGRASGVAVMIPGGPAGTAPAFGLGGPGRPLGGPVLLGLPSPHASVAALLAAVLTALPLAARRLYPITVWLVIAAAIVAVHPAYVPPVALGTAVYAAYSAITHSRYRNLAIAMVAVVTFAVAGTLGPDLPRFPGRLTAIFAILPATAAGLGIRELRRRLADSTARLRRAATEAAAATERALAAERARIASELHDVVTHNVSVMIVQAGAARKIMAFSPPDAEDALLAVEATGREAMTELRNLLGLLSPAADGRDSGSGACSPGPAAGPRAAGGPAVPRPQPASRPRPVPPRPALRPQPGLGELDALIGRVSAAGVQVELQVSGEPRPLSPGADLAAYRVVQEGLTNVLRHAGPATATVGVEWGEELVITVSDDGDRGASWDGSGAGSGSGNGSGGTPGRGLLGGGARGALLGGVGAGGPRPGGGWQVRAAMPAGTVS
jgi:signal transduction histidine kinase